MNVLFGWLKYRFVELGLELAPTKRSAVVRSAHHNVRQCGVVMDGRLGALEELIAD